MNKINKKAAIELMVTTINSGDKNTWGILTAAYPNATSDQKIAAIKEAYKKVNK